MVATPGTIPSLTPYQPGALPITGQEALEIVSSVSATAAVTGYMLLTDFVGKSASVLGSQQPTSNDLVTLYQKSTGLPFSSTVGNLGVPSGNVPTGGTVGQILEKNSSTNFDASWGNLSSLLTASTAITLAGSTTVAVSITPQGIGAVQIATNAVGAGQFRQSVGLSVVGNASTVTGNVADITATAGNQLLITNAGNTGLLFTTLAVSLLPGPFQVSSFTSNGVVYGNGTSALGATAAGTAGLFLQANGTLSPPAYALVNVGAATNITGVLNVVNGGHGTSTLTSNGVVYGTGSTSPIGVTAAGTTAWPLVANGTSAAPAFAVLTVPGGGTGTTTFTPHGVMLGEGAGTLGVTSVGTTGFILAGNTGADPSFQAISSLMISTLTMTGGLSVLGLGTSGGSVGVGNATITNVRLVSAKTAAYTFVNTDLATLVTFSSGALATATIPQASATIGSAFAGGWFVDVENLATALIVLAPQTSLINGIATFGLNKGQGLRIVSDGTNYQIGAGGALAVNISNTAQVFSGGLRLVAYNLGTTATGSTIVLDSGSGPVQRLVNNGAFTFSAPTNDGELDVMVINSTSASTITFSGFNVGANTGDAYTTTNNSKFILMARTIAGFSTYKWAALQ